MGTLYEPRAYLLGTRADYGWHMSSPLMVVWQGHQARAVMHHSADHSPLTTLGPVCCTRVGEEHGRHRPGSLAMTALEAAERCVRVAQRLQEGRESAEAEHR